MAIPSHQEILARITGTQARPIRQKITKAIAAGGEGAIRETGDLIKDIGKGAISVARAVPQGIARTALSIFGIEEAQPKGIVQKVVLGKEPIKNVPKYGEETLKSFGASPETSKKYALPLGIALTAADLYPGAGGKSKLVSKIAKESSEEAVFKILQSSVKNIDDDIARAAASRLAKISDKTLVEKELASLIKNEIQPPTQSSVDVVDKSLKTSPEIVKKEQTLYHGTTKGGFAQFDNEKMGYGNQGKGIYLTNSQKIADYHSAMAESDAYWVKNGKMPPELFSGGLGETLNVNVHPNLNIKVLDKMPTKLQVDKIKSDGFDGVTFPDEIVREDWKSSLFGEYPKKGEAKTTMIFDGKNVTIKKTKNIGLEKQLNTKERKFITSTKEAEPELETRVAGQYIPRSTDELSIKAANLIKDNIDEAERVARTQTDDVGVATASELIKKYTLDARNATDSAIRNAMFDKAADIANVIAPKLTETGRAVQAASILGRQTPEGILRFAARQIQKHNEEVIAQGGKNLIPELTGKQTGSILEKMKKVEELPDGVGKAKAFKEVEDEINKLVPTPLMDKLIAIWKAGLLTGVKTHGLNTFSNLFHGVTEGLKDIPAAAVDSVASLFTGERTIGLTAKGAGSGLKEGFSKGWDYLKTGFDERDLSSKLDRKKINWGNSKISKALGAYTDGVFRVLGAEDQPWYYGARAHSIYSQAIAAGKTQGLKGKELTKFVDDFIQNPPEKSIMAATLDAETAVFQNKTFLSERAKKVQGGVGQVILPFAKTPAAVAMQLFNYSPAGVFTEVGKQVYDGIKYGKKFDQRAFSQAFGRSATGLAPLVIGMELYKQGMLRLAPKTDREKKLMELEGSKSNYVLIDGKWRNSNILGPAGSLLVIAGYFQKALKEEGSIWSALSSALTGAGKTLVDQTFLKGLADVSAAVSDPINRGSNYLSSQLGSIIPTLVSDLAKASDEDEREINGLLGSLYSRLPGLRDELEPKINVLGETVKRGGSVLETLIDPTRPSRALNTPVVNELRRLNEAGIKATPTTFIEKNEYTFLSEEEKTQLELRAGQILAPKLDRLIEREEYKESSDEDKKNLIEDFYNEARDVARAEKVLEMTDGKSTDEIKEILSQLKSENFLTKNVFKRWEAMR